MVAVKLLLQSSIVGVRQILPGSLDEPLCLIIVQQKTRTFASKLVLLRNRIFAFYAYSGQSVRSATSLLGEVGHGENTHTAGDHSDPQPPGLSTSLASKRSRSTRPTATQKAKFVRLITESTP